ncbi:MAG: hypothetical protein EOP66_02325 [Sphingomonas sp.]|nr:MAG: hypothetical protein EOP66_02325 [Sphingomonas sp.]
MVETLRPATFEITAFEGRVLIETPGNAATLDVDGTSLLSDSLLAACGSARLQQHAAIEEPVEPRLP